MVKGLKARGSKFFRTHPDMSSDDSNAEEVLVFEKDEGESVSESESSIELTSKKQLQGVTQEDDDMRKMLASGKEGGGRGKPLPKAKAKEKVKAEADSDETDAKKQKQVEEAEKQQKGRGGGAKGGTPNREEQGVFARVPEIAC